MLPTPGNVRVAFVRGNPQVDWAHVAAGTSLRMVNADYPAVDQKAAFLRIYLAGRQLQAYDANSNMTTDQTGKTFVYDAWNRLVDVKSGTTILVSYTFDALGRRVRLGAASLQSSSEKPPESSMRCFSRNRGSRPAYMSSSAFVR